MNHTLLFSSILLFLLLSCSKQNELRESQIHVVDNENQSQARVLVDVYKMENGLELINSGRTNWAGKYVFAFPEAGVYSVIATRIDSSIIYNNSVVNTETFCGQADFSITEKSSIDCTVQILKCD